MKRNKNLGWGLLLAFVLWLVQMTVAAGAGLGRLLPLALASAACWAGATAWWLYRMERGAKPLEQLEETLKQWPQPQALEELPPPQAVFIGGSKGNLQAILQAALAKNPRVRVVMNAIALETLGQAAALLGQLGFERTEIVQVAVSRAKQAGPYHMMMGQNPVFILRGEGGTHD